MSQNSGTSFYIMLALITTGVLSPAPSGQGSALAQVRLPPLQGPIGRPLDPALERVDRIGRRIEREVPEAAEAADEEVDEVTGEAVDGLTGTVNAVTGQAVQDVNGVVNAALRPFELDMDPAGSPIERDLAVVLLDDRQLQSATLGGLEIAAQRKLQSMGLTLVTLRKPAGADLSQTITDLRTSLPGVAVDFNHVYRFAAETFAVPAGEESQDANASPDSVPAKAGVRVGMIDSAVKSDHPALRDSTVVNADFVSNDGVRPLGHGTAVASLIARSSNHDAEIYAASVFFQTGNHAPGATTESLVAALDWLAAERVHVINMSLAGPGNALLERAIAAMADNAPVIVAAVGNNGPSGEPLYPAAYDDVIGITAVDREHRIFRYANRGEHVDFAALGVNVKVADSGGSWRMESGTSMASPHVAVVVARMQRTGPLAHDTLRNALAAGAEDLGRRGFDSTFGHGLVTEPPVLLSQQ
ncbi:MAG TPA: S8 family serine peptidase [Woeseiaceae bacterium]|nr:S8 family serine peptidase [Woeseiaceae bacterium]